jgi:polyisoprenyl-phosphate glycosyltransferase
MADCTEVGSNTPRRPLTGVSLVIPCKNEAGGIGKTVSEIHEVFAKHDWDYEIIVVDDGSSDNSAEEAVAAGAHVLVHERNIGYGSSIMDGINIARFPAVAIMDADGTYPAEELPSMLRRLETSNLVVGARQWREENTTPMALMFRRLLYWVILYLTSQKAPDFNSGLRVFWRDEIRKFQHLLCPTFSFTTTMTLLYMITYRNVQFVPIHYAKRIGRSHVNYFRDALRTLTFVLLIANLFRIYRLTAMVIAMMVAANAFVGLVFWAIGVGAAAAVAWHLVITAAFIFAMMSFNTMLETTIYAGSLHRHDGEAE